MDDIIERAKKYNEQFNKYPPLVWTTEPRVWIYGYWIIGNYYKNKSSYYGTYPHSYLKRIKSMFGDIPTWNTLHLFAGEVDTAEFPGTTFDINPELKPDIVGDAHNLTDVLQKHQNIYQNKTWELIIADPPYSDEDATHYGTPMVNRNKVVKECTKLLCKGGYLVWLDQVSPMFRKDELERIGSIGLERSTNHRVRSVFIWRKR